MRCAYCGRESKATREHIISSGILDLFPECFLTFDGNHKVIHQADPMVKDVCAACNNDRISYIDSYAKQIVQQYFLRKYEADSVVEIEYNYTLLQKMLLKYAFNDLRARQDDISFFNKDVLGFLLNEDIAKPMDNVTVLAGLAVNTSPAPDFMFGNLKLQWCKSPVFMANSMVENIDYTTGQIRIREPFEVETFEGLLLSYIFRFNSGQFILLCWDKDSPKLEQNLTVIKLQYPYTMLHLNEKHPPWNDALMKRPITVSNWLMLIGVMELWMKSPLCEGLLLVPIMKPWKN